MHPVSLRCSWVKYSRYSPSSGVATRLPIPGYDIWDPPTKNRDQGASSLSMLSPTPRTEHWQAAEEAGLRSTGRSISVSCFRRPLHVGNTTRPILGGCPVPYQYKEFLQRDTGFVCRDSGGNVPPAPPGGSGPAVVSRLRDGTPTATCGA
jgi:hypothetical protein